MQWLPYSENYAMVAEHSLKTLLFAGKRNPSFFLSFSSFLKSQGKWRFGTKIDPGTQTVLPQKDIPYRTCPAPAVSPSLCLHLDWVISSVKRVSNLLYHFSGFPRNAFHTALWIQIGLGQAVSIWRKEVLCAEISADFSICLWTSLFQQCSHTTMEYQTAGNCFQRHHKQCLG